MDFQAIFEIGELLAPVIKLLAAAIKLIAYTVKTVKALRRRKKKPP